MDISMQLPSPCYASQKGMANSVNPGQTAPVMGCQFLTGNYPQIPLPQPNSGEFRKFYMEWPQM